MDNTKQNSKLPEGWSWTTLGELGIVVSGGTPSTKEPLFWEGDITWVTPADLSDYKGKYLRKGARKITQLGLDNSSAVLLPKGSLLFSSRAPIGYVVIALNELATSQGFKNLIPVPSTYVDFLYYYLQYAKSSIIKMASGTTFLELSAKNFSKIPIPLAPLKEQHRIVEKIEELFSEIDNAEETIRDIKFKLEVCKNSVLEQILFKGNLSGQIVPIGDVVNRISVKVYPSTSPNLKFVGLDSIEPKTLEIRRIYNFKDYASSGNYFERGHILYSRMRPYLNKVTKANFNGAASGEYIVLECKKDILNDYLLYILHSGAFVNYANQRSIGDRPRLSFEDLSQFEIYLGNLEEQAQAINDIEYYFTIIDNLQKTLTEVENQTLMLRQGILMEAFEGQLVSHINTDESARELIDRINREKIQYLEKQKELIKNKPQKQTIMEDKKTILEILQSANTPLLAEDVWLQSEHKNNIENFYAELKKIQNQIVATKKNSESFLQIKK